MALAGRTIPTFSLCKFIYSEAKFLRVMLPKRNFLRLSNCVYPTSSHIKTFLQKHYRIPGISHKSNFVSIPLLSANILSIKNEFQRFPEFENHFRRCYHVRSRLSVEDNVYLSYLQSLVNELKGIEEAQSKKDHTPDVEKEERIRIARYQFLLGANEVMSKVLEKQAEISELKSLSSDEQDSDMKEMMLHEMEKLGKEIQHQEEELIDVLAGDEPADKNDIVLEVSAGVGGQEAMLFCAEVFHMYCQYGRAKGWNVGMVDKDENELGGYRKATAEISGFDVYRWLKYEAGVHRVQRVPKTEKGGRVHTSTVSVSVLPQPREIDVQIEKKDLKVETFRNSGPGGQSVNTTDSAVRITHIPSGTVAECKQERSQIKNRDHAMKVLKMRLYQAQLEEEEANRKATRKMQIGSRGRSEKIRTYNYQQDRVTDHRVKENFSNLPEFMAGGEGLEDLIASLEQDFKYKVVESMVDLFELAVKSGSQDNKNKKTVM